MAWTNLVKKAVATGAVKEFFDAIVDNLTFVYNRLSTIGETLIPNGSFERDGDEDGIPDGWVVTILQAGAAAEVAGIHGEKAFGSTRSAGAGNGGRQIESEDYIPLAELGGFSFRCFYKATAALQSKVEVLFFDAALNPVETRTICDVSLEMDWRTLFHEGYTPEGARYAKLRLTGGTTAVDVAGVAAFDGVSFMFAPLTPVMPGAEFSRDDADWFTVASIPVPIPGGATTLAATVELKNGVGTGVNVYFRAKINATTGTEQNTASAGYVPKTSAVTLDAGDKGEVRTLELQVKADGGLTAYLNAYSDVSGGYEANIIIE